MLSHLTDHPPSYHILQITLSLYRSPCHTLQIILSHILQIILSHLTDHPVTSYRSSCHILQMTLSHLTDHPVTPYRSFSLSHFTDRPVTSYISPHIVRSYRSPCHTLQIILTVTSYRSPCHILYITSYCQILQITMSHLTDHLNVKSYISPHHVTSYRLPCPSYRSPCPSYRSLSDCHILQITLSHLTETVLLSFHPSYNNNAARYNSLLVSTLSICTMSTSVTFFQKSASRSFNLNVKVAAKNTQLITHHFPVWP